MKLAFFVFVVSVLMVVSPHIAKADLDQLCLKQCINAGQASSSCMTRCTYNTPIATAPKSVNADQYTSSNRVLGTLTPATQGPMLKTQQAPGVAPVDRDYVCLNQCLRTKRPYDVCESGCTKSSCDPGAVLCATSSAMVTGATSGAIPSSTISTQAAHP